MSTFSTINTQLESRIANSSETFYDSETKVQAVNDTINEIMKEYDIPEMIKRSTLTFAATGIVAKPSDYLRMVKLWDTDSNGVQNKEFQYIEPDKYDSLASTASYYWTEDWVVADAARELKILPITSGTVDTRYIKAPSAVESTGATDSGLSTLWDESIVYGTAMRLFQISNRWDEAREFERLYKKTVSDTYLLTKKPGGVKGNVRIKSKFERQSLLGGFLANDYDNTN